MNCRNQIISFTKIRKFYRILKPSCFKQRIKSIFSTSINYTRTNYEDFNIFSFESKNFILDLFDKLILWERNSWLIINILPESIFNRFVLNNLIWLFSIFLFWVITCLLIFLCIFRIGLILSSWRFIFSICSSFSILIIYFWRWIFLDFSIGMTPYHNITD